MVDIKMRVPRPFPSRTKSDSLACGLAFGIVTNAQGILVSGQVWGLLLGTQPPAVEALRGLPDKPRD